MQITVRVQAANAKREIEYLRAQIKTLEAALGKASSSASGMFDGGLAGLSRWGSGMQWAGRQLSANFTLPIIAAGTAMTKWALDAEGALVQIRKVYGDATGSGTSFLQLQDSFIQAFDLLSVKYGEQVVNVRNIAAEWAAAGATGAALARGTEATLQAMVLGGMDAASSAEALISIQAQWGKSTEDLMVIIQQMNATENATGITFQGLVEGMQRSSSVARTAGIDVKYLLAMLAALTPASGTAAQSGNALKTMISRLLSPTKEAAEVLGLMGINMADVNWKSLDGAQRLEVLARAYHNLEGSTQDVMDAEGNWLSSQAAVVSQVVASRYQINRFDQLMRDIYASTDDSAESNGYYGRTLEILGDQGLVARTAINELKAVLESTPMVAQRSGVVIQNSLMKVIQQILPQILWLIQGFAELTQRFSEMDPLLQKVILGFLALLAAIGPPLVILGSLVVAVSRVAMMLKSVGGMVSWVTGLFGKFGTAGSGLMGKLRALVAKVIPAMESASAAATTAATTLGTQVGNAYGTSFTRAIGASTQPGMATIYATPAKAASSLNAATAATATATTEMSALIRAGGASAVKDTLYTWNVVVNSTAVATRTVAGDVDIMEARVNANFIRISILTDQTWTRIITVTSAGVAQVVAIVDAGLATIIATTGAAGAAVVGETAIVVNALILEITAGTAAVNAAVGTSFYTFTNGILNVFVVLQGFIQRLIGTSAASAFQLGYLSAQAAQAGALAAQASGAGAVRAGAAALGTQTGTAIGAASGAALTRTITGTVVTTTAAAGTVASKGFFARFIAGIAAFIPKVGAALLAGLKGILVFVKTWGLRLLTLFTGPWGAAIVAVLTLLFMFRDQIAQFFDNIKRQANDSTSHFGKAWQATVELANKAFRALPEGVQGALRAVVTMVKNAAMKVYEFFSYMNPFARHSPSLVENVTNGMAVVGQQFGLAAETIKRHMTTAYMALNRFGVATAGFISKVNGMAAAEERKKIAKFIPNAIKVYDELNATLGPLRQNLEDVALAIAKQEAVVNKLKGAMEAQQRVVDSLQKTYDQLADRLQSIQDQMDAAQAKIDEFANTGIAGQRAMSDAIFENEMAQKRLRLEILRLEEASGTVTDLRSRLASLQGDIDTLRGRLSDLRYAGAGSDILGPIQAQIAAMEAEYRALSNGADIGTDATSALQKQLEELQKQGEILDLENSIKFDPLERQIDQLTDNYKELPFDQIVGGIRQQQSELARLRPEYDAANKALQDQGKLLEAAKVELDANTLAYNQQKDVLDGLQTTYSAIEDQIRNVEEAIRSVVSAADDMQQALDEAARAAKEASDNLSPGAQNFLDAAGGSFEDTGGYATIGDESGDLQAWIDEFLADSANIFDNIDLFAPIREKWEAFKAWWNDNVTPIFSNLWDGVVSAAEGVDWGAPFAAITDFFGTSTVGQALADWWDRVSGPMKELWDSLSTEFEKAWNKLEPSLIDLREALRPVGDMFVWLWENAIKPFGGFLGEWLPKILGGLIGTLGAIIGGIIILVSNMISNVVGPIIQWVSDVISRVVDLISGIIETWSAIFRGDWQAVWDGIVGTVVDVWNLIYAVFSGAFGFIGGLVSGFVEGIVSWFEWLYDILVGHSIVPDLVNAVIDWFASLPGKVIQFIKDLWTGVVNWFTAVKDDAIRLAVDIWTGVTTWFDSIKTDAINKVKELKDGVVNYFVTTKDNVIQTAKDVWNGVVNWFNTLKTDTIQKIEDLKTGAGNKFTEIKDDLVGKAGSLRDAVLTPILTLRDNFLAAFQTVRDNVSGIFDSIKTKVQNGMNGPIQAINALIKGLNKVADALPGIDWNISLIPEFAAGGALPTRVGGGFKTAGARAIVGEGNPAHPEYVIPTDPAYRGRALNLLASLQSQLNVPTDDAQTALGGPVEDITAWIGNAAESATDWMQNVANGAVSTVFKPFKDIIDGKIAEITWDLGKNMVQTGVDKVLGWIDNADQSFRDIEKTMGGTWGRPMDRYAITSRYGPRSMFGNSFHTGTDLANGGGSTIKAASQGTVVRQGFNSVAGRTGMAVVLQHAKAMFSYYGHLASAAVKIGDIVKAGQKVGIEGATGNVTGPHLHFEVHDGAIGRAVNPETFMRAKGVPLAEGGIVRARNGGTLATIGEAGRDEAVIPLPSGWQNIWSVLGSLDNVIHGMSVQTISAGSLEVQQVVMPAAKTEGNVYNFNGNLEFPNVSNGDDARDFIRNLEDLAGSR